MLSPIPRIQRFIFSDGSKPTVPRVSRVLPPGQVCDSFRRDVLQFVVGYANRVAQEVNVRACAQRGVPILRRCTGGGAVLQGPGCLNYSLILQIDSDPLLQTVTGTNRFVMERNRGALEMLLSGSSRRKEALTSNLQLPTSNFQLSVCGHTDLAIDGRKFSGNAQ